MYNESSGGAGDDDTTTTSTNLKITHFKEIQHDSRNNRSTYTSAASFGSAVIFGDDNRLWSKMHSSVRNDGDRGDADDEAPKDPRISEQDFTQHFTENDFEGHRAHTVYVGVHCLPGSRHHSQRRRKHHHVKVDGGAGEKQSERPVTPPAQRVQFILGEDGDDSGTISHPLFSEYLTLVKEGDEYEWKETARWIKFEEVVEEGGNRWSKPHVATLSLHSLFELRNILLNGTIILDMEATNLEVIADLVCENMVNSGGLPLQSRDKVKDALLRRHRHQHEYTRKHKLPLIRSLADIGRNQSSSKSEYCHIAPVHLGSIGLTSWFHSEIAPYYDSCTSAGISLIKVVEQHSTQSAPGITTALSNSSNCDAHLISGRSEADLNNDGRYLTVPGIRIQKALGSPDEKLKRLADAKHNHHPLPIIAEDMSKSPSSQSMQGNGYSSGTDIGEHRSNMNFMRKIPPGAEASNILVGEVEFLQKPLAAFIRLKDASPMGDLTEVPVPTRFIFILLGPPSSQSNFHEIGRAMATLMSDEIFHEVAYRARKRDHLLAGIDEFLEAVTVLPPGEWDPTIRIEPPAAIPSQDMRKRPPEAPKEKIDEEEEEQRLREESGLSRSGRLFGGLLNDIRRKIPWYLSDFRDALSMQCVASWIFLYFACLSPIITFGGLLSQATGKNMAAMESLVSGFVCGIGYGLFSGQPLTILGSTGPVLVFETIVYEFCEQRGWDYMTFRFWIGTWIAIILMILTAIDASALVCYITRFTEENFATLIAFIFIYKAVENVLKIGQKYPINHPVYDCICAPPIPSNATILDYVKFDKKLCLANNGTMIGLDCDKPDTSNIFLMSVLLFLGTFIISTLLKDFKNALFFPTIVRQYISDFSVIIAIVSMSFLDYMMKVDTPKLEVPHELKPTLPTRNWMITPFNDKNPFWSSFAAIVPAMLGTILIFMDQQITAVIVNRKENKLRKGCGYHLDLFVLSILIQICSIMGLPWFVAATVLSINHVNSLKLESECSAPGEKPQFLGVREQRVTHILIFLTIGLSVFLTPILSHIPMPVLFGVFLYMGVASLKGLQFFDRMLILFMPAKYQPDYMFLRQVPIKRVHLFTLIQLTCLIILWLIKSFSSTSILFPLMLVVMIGIRKSLDLLFTRRELKILDDIMPEMTKRAAADDDLHQLDAAEEPQSDTHKKCNTGPTTLHIPLANGSTNTAAALHPSKNTSQEMPYTSTWQQEINSDRKPIISQLIIPANVTVRHIGGGGKNSINTDDKPAVIASASIMPEDNTDKMDFNNIKNIQVDITHV